MTDNPAYERMKDATQDTLNDLDVTPSDLMDAAQGQESIEVHGSVRPETAAKLLEAGVAKEEE